MTTITDVQMAEWLRILESDPWEDELSGLARKAIPILCAEVERLRADLAREKMISAAGWGAANLNADEMMRVVEENIPGAIAELRAEIEKVHAERDDDRLKWAEVGAKDMRLQTAAIAASERQRWPLYASVKFIEEAILALDPAAVARRAVEEQKATDGR